MKEEKQERSKEQREESLVSKRWDESGKGNYALEYDDVKKAVLEFRKGLDKMCEYGYDDTPNDIFQTYDEIFGDFEK